MRWLAWTMLMAIAVGAAGVNGEFNPVLRQPHHASVENATGRVIVKFRPADSSPQRAKLRSTQDRISALMARTGLKLRAVRSVTELLHGIRVEQQLPESRSGRRSSACKRIPRSSTRKPSSGATHTQQRPTIPCFSQQWYLQGSSTTTPSAVDAVTAWDTTTGSTGLVIADLDTGVRFEHPDLQWAGSGGRLLPGYTFISDTFVAMTAMRGMQTPRIRVTGSSRQT